MNIYTQSSQKRPENLEIFSLQKHFLKTIEGEMFIRRQKTNLLQIFCEISLHSQVILKSMKVADDISREKLLSVNGLKQITVLCMSLRHISMVAKLCTRIGIDLVYDTLQYRHFIPASVDRTSASAWLNKHQCIHLENKSSTSMTHAASESKLG